MTDYLYGLILVGQSTRRRRLPLRVEPGRDHLVGRLCPRTPVKEVRKGIHTLRLCDRSLCQIKDKELGPTNNLGTSSKHFYDYGSCGVTDGGGSKIKSQDPFLRSFDKKIKRNTDV